jgi:regulator of sirC expression with transglutaminase-like and TPR domain
MDPTERFTEVVQRAERDVPLDEAALLIAAHHHEVDVPVQLARFDDLAIHAPPAPDALATYLFVERGFAGNSVDYADPRNSLLDDVLDRRLGIPITLSVLMMEIGKRVGCSLDGIGMPGHFLVGAGNGTFFDPFHGGERLDEDGCRERFTLTQGDAPFLPRYLAPVGSHAILSRMLANLVRSFVTRDPAAAVWALRLRLRIPDVSAAERREAAALLGTLGQFEEAAEVLAAVAEELDGPRRGGSNATPPPTALERTEPVWPLRRWLTSCPCSRWVRSCSRMASFRSTCSNRDTAR